MSMCESILTIALVCTVKYLHYCDYYYTLGNDSQSTPKLIAYGTVARTPYERLMDPRGICILQDVFGGGLGVRKAYGYRYEMRDPDQPVRDGFDLGDFLRSTLTGGLMGGLSGVAFYGMDKAVEALEGSLSGGGKGGTHVLPNAEDLKNVSN